jgi:hypothetical protein
LPSTRWISAGAAAFAFRLPSASAAITRRPGSLSSSALISASAASALPMFSSALIAARRTSASDAFTKGLMPGTASG